MSVTKEELLAENLSLSAKIERLKEELEALRVEVTNRGDWLVEWRKAQAEIEALRGKYNELIMSVGNKYHNETRHETALRYIRKAETTDGVAAVAARLGDCNHAWASANNPHVSNAVVCLNCGDVRARPGGQG